MTKKISRVMRRALLVSVSSVLCLMAQPLAAQETDAELMEAPLFEVNPLFEDGVSTLAPADGKEILLKRSANQALVKFADDPEVRALEISQGPGNSELFKNDTDVLLLRLTDRGNVSLYTPDYPGEPLSRLGSASEFPVPEAEADDFAGRLSSYLSIRAHRNISVEIAQVPTAEAGWLQDAARVAGKATLKLMGKVDAVRLIRIERAEYGDARFLEDGTLVISVAPARGYFGRPSSDHIIAVIKHSFDS